MTVRHPRARRRRARRRTDRSFTTTMQRVILAVSASGVIYGQAELLGEPWRHVLAVGGVVILVWLAVWMKQT